MAWRIVKQPNGRYARFSDIVDHFTHQNYTWQGMYSEIGLARGAVLACKKLNQADENRVEYWKQSLETIKRVHSVREMNRVIKLDEEIA